MDIYNLEGRTGAELQADVARGGRFVVYQYVVSVILVSFKRVSGIRYVPAGTSAAVGGLPCTGISLLFGWWGIPWGIIYTIQSVFRNLRGIDVTDDVLPFVLQREGGIDHRLALMQRDQAAREPVVRSRAEAGDWVRLQLAWELPDGGREGAWTEEHPFGVGELVPEIERTIAQLKVGEEGIASLPVGKEHPYWKPGGHARISVRLVDIYTLELSPLDDAFAQRNGHAHLRALRAAVRAELEEQAAAMPPAR